MRDSSTNLIIGEAFRRHLAVAEGALREILPAAQKAAETLLRVVKNGGKVLVCGNGGSAADAQHFAGEWVCRYKDDRRPLAAIALTVDTSALTAIGNDYGFENVFSRQVEALGSPGDVLIVFTTSGPAKGAHSRNILNAVGQAKTKGMKVIVLTGAKGQLFKDLVDVAIVVPSEETARIQEVHEIVYHAWCEAVDLGLSAGDKK